MACYMNQSLRFALTDCIRRTKCYGGLHTSQHHEEDNSIKNLGHNLGNKSGYQDISRLRLAWTRVHRIA